MKPYELFVEAMTEMNKVAIGRIVMRSKERLVAIRPLDGMLCVSTMRYSDEIVSREGLIPDEAADIEIAERERLMAKQLIESLSSETFDATKYHDEYREQLLDLIERKAAGEEIVGEPEVEAPAKVLDLVAALEASLAKAATAKERHPASVRARDRPRQPTRRTRKTTRPRRRSHARRPRRRRRRRRPWPRRPRPRSAPPNSPRAISTGCSSSSQPHSWHTDSPSDANAAHGSHRTSISFKRCLHARKMTSG